MSNHFINWARVQKAGGVAPKALLLVLADHANSEGICWPGIALLATTLECDEKTIRRNLNKLFKADLVFRLNNGNQNKNTTYLLAPYGPFQEIKEELSELDILPASQDSEVDILPASYFSNGEVKWTFCPSEVDISPRAYSIKEPSMNHQRNNNTPPTTEEGVVVVIQKNPDFFFSFETMWEKANPEMDERDCFKNWNEIDLDLLLYYSNEGEISPKSADFKDMISRSATNATKSPRAYLLSL